MKKLLLSLFIALACVRCTPVFSQTQPTPVAVDSASRVNRNVKFGTGKTLTIEAGATLQLDGTLTGGGTIAVTVPVANTLFVDPVNGDDGTAERGNLGKPYESFDLAAGEAMAGDTIFLMKGTHTVFAGYTLAAGVSVIGEGPGVSILQGSHSVVNGVDFFTPIITVSGKASVANLTLKHTRVSNSAGNADALLITASDDADVWNCEILGDNAVTIEAVPANDTVTVRSSRLTGLASALYVNSAGNANTRVDVRETSLRGLGDGTGYHTAGNFKAFTSNLAENAMSGDGTLTLVDCDIVADIGGPGTISNGDAMFTSTSWRDSAGNALSITGPGTARGTLTMFLCFGNATGTSNHVAPSWAGGGGGSAGSLADGSAAAPSVAFAADTNTGLYRIGADQLGITTGGTLRITTSTTAFTSTLPFYAPNGAAATPSVTFAGDTNTGLFTGAADQLSLAAGGTELARVVINGVSLFTTLLAFDGDAGDPGISFNNDINTGFYRVSADSIGVTTGGTRRLTISTSQFSATLPWRGQDGTAALPGLSFDNDNDTGIYRIGANNFGLAANGAKVVDVATTGVAITGGLTVSGISSGIVNSASGVLGTQTIPKFCATRDTDQVITTATFTKVAWANEDFDTNGNFDSTTNNRFTPTVAGKYSLHATVWWNGGSATSNTALYLYKNGALFKRFDAGPMGTSIEMRNGTAFVDANGSTDYFEVFVYQDSGSNRTITGGASLNHFSGFLVP